MLNGFDNSNIQKLTSFLGENQKGIAVFDADGTLWRGDIGESFFKQQIQQRSMPSAPKNEDLWKKYWDAVHTGEAKKAYEWLGYWNAGSSYADLEKSTRLFFKKNFEMNVFEPMRGLVKAMTDSGFEVWVLSASPKWVVEAGAELAFGIPANRVAGLTMAVKNGILTDKIEGQLPYREGKVAEFKRVISDAPVFAAGNTYWDKDVLSLCRGLVLTVHSENPSEPNYESEQKLKNLAETKNWLVQRF